LVLAFVEKQLGEFEIERCIDVDGALGGDERGFQDAIEDAIAGKYEIR